MKRQREILLTDQDIYVLRGRPCRRDATEIAMRAAYKRAHPQLNETGMRLLTHVIQSLMREGMDTAED